MMFGGEIIHDACREAGFAPRVVLTAGHCLWSIDATQVTIALGYDLTAPNACFGPVKPFPAGTPLPSTAPAQPAAPVASFNLVQSGQ